MLKKKERLTRGQFDECFKKGKKIRGYHLDLSYTPSTNFHGAVVVGKRVYKRAVDRNKLRRQIYNLVYNLKKNNDIKGVFIILTKPPVSTLKYADLKNEVQGLLAKAVGWRLE